MHLAVLDSVQSLGEKQWNALIDKQEIFNRYGFIYSLEQSGVIGGKTGWQGHHFAFYEQDTLIGLIPGYLKGHSYGEFVFDFSWAQSYEQHGLSYYPKWIAAVPFTPATGQRLFFNNAEDITAALDLIKQHLMKQGISGAHILFDTQDESLHLHDQQFHTRLGVQFHWFNQQYQDFDDFLTTCKARKRKTIKKERQQVVDQGISLQWIEGQNLTPEILDQFYQHYQTTNLKYRGQSGYLNKACFETWQQKMGTNIRLCVAYQNDQAIASAWYFINDQQLFGRYWGATVDIPSLHFEACYYQSIEYAIKHKLTMVDPGAQGEHKIKRGFTPTLTYSNHFLDHPSFQEAVANFLYEEQQHIKQYQKDASALLPFK